MRVNVVIPAYNEAAIIEDTLAEVHRTLGEAPFEYAVFVADNASTDGTAEKVAGLGQIQVLSVSERGKGAALRTAARRLTDGHFAFLDADISAHPRELIALHDVMVREGADIVIGSRLVDRSGVRRSYLRTLSSQVFNFLRRWLLGIRVADTQCGAKLMNERGRELLAACTESGWFFDIELLARAERAGLTIREVPVAWEEFRYPDRPSKLNVLRDGVRGVAALLRIRSQLNRESHGKGSL